MYNTLKKLIENGRYEIESMKRKLDIYLLANRISEDEYKELLALLQ